MDSVIKWFKSSRNVIPAILAFTLISCQGNTRLTPGEGYVQVEGGKLWYDVIGEGKGIPVVMLHGGPGGSSRGLYRFIELGRDRPLILYDQLGSGLSDAVSDTSLMTVKNFVEQLRALKTTLGLKEFYLYGHSWGTALALEYYLAYPEGIKGLIFNSPYFSTHTWLKDADTLVGTLPDSIQTIIEKAKQSKIFSSPDFRRANELFASSYTYRKPVDRTGLPAQKSSSNGREIYEYMWGPCEFVSTGTLRDYDVSYGLSEIKIPSLFITGEFDEARPVTVKRFQDMVPGSEFQIIYGAAHATMNDNILQNITAIEDFIKKVEY